MRVTKKGRLEVSVGSVLPVAGELDFHAGVHERRWQELRGERLARKAERKGPKFQRQDLQRVFLLMFLLWRQKC